MTVRAFLATDPAVKPLPGRSDEARIFTYEGPAILFPHNSTVLHIVTNSSDADYVGRRLYRHVNFTDESDVLESDMLLTPQEKVGVARGSPYNQWPSHY